MIKRRKWKNFQHYYEIIILSNIIEIVTSFPRIFIPFPPFPPFSSFYCRTVLFHCLPLFCFPSCFCRVVAFRLVVRFLFLHRLVFFSTVSTAFSLSFLFPPIPIRAPRPVPFFLFPPSRSFSSFSPSLFLLAIFFLSRPETQREAYIPAIIEITRTVVYEPWGLSVTRLIEIHVLKVDNEITGGTHLFVSLVKSCVLSTSSTSKICNITLLI